MEQTVPSELQWSLYQIVQLQILEEMIKCAIMQLQLNCCKKRFRAYAPFWANDSLIGW